jgi:hypothetical protein
MVLSVEADFTALPIDPPAGQDASAGSNIIFGVPRVASQHEQFKELAAEVLIGCIARRVVAIEKVQHRTIGQEFANEISHVAERRSANRVVLPVPEEVGRLFAIGREVVVPEPHHPLVEPRFGRHHANHPFARELIPFGVIIE